MTEELTVEDVKAIEAEIISNLSSAADRIVFAIEAKLYTLTGDKSGSAWLARLLDGTGFTFSSKKQGDERSARNVMIIALINDGAPLATIADTLGISIGTVHAVKKDEGLVSVGGDKPGAGRQSTDVAVIEPEPIVTGEIVVNGKVVETVPLGDDDNIGENSGETDEGAEVAPRTRTAPDPVKTAFNAVDKIAANDDADTMLDEFALLYAYLVEKSGYTATQLRDRAKQLAKAAKA